MAYVRNCENVRKRDDLMMSCGGKQTTRRCVFVRNEELPSRGRNGWNITESE